jgi:alpha-L-rhamnosidase
MNCRTFLLSLLGITAFTEPMAAHAAEPAAFRSAKPIWPKGRETEMNLLGGFRAVIHAPTNAKKVVLRVTAAYLYRAWLNGEFVGYGPARGPRGFYRVDEWDITKRLTPGKNLVAIEAVGYNCFSYYLLNQPSACQAEVVADDRVLASTAGEGAQFAVNILDYRVQKVERRVPRTFVEAYRMKPGWDAWLRDGAAAWPGVETAVQAEKRYLPRGVPYPEFAVRAPVQVVDRGQIKRRDPKLPKYEIPTLPWNGWPEKELWEITSQEMARWDRRSSRLSKEVLGKSPIALAGREYVTVDLGESCAGFIGVTVRCTAPTRLVVTDVPEMPSISYELEKGEYRLENIEPHSIARLTFMCLRGDCSLWDIYVREYAHPETREASFHSSNEHLNKRYRDALVMFRQCAVDIFMDCATRERVGWLGDSYCTARVANVLTGTTLVERNFLENFALADRYGPELPKGMLPCCYPGGGESHFIHSWAMWFVDELEEYLARSGDRALVDSLRPRVLGLLGFFKQYENSDGLLEKLPGWVLIDFSKADSLTNDVNYPTNMHYASIHDTMARLYGLPELATKAARLRETIRRQSFDGEFFVDNAIRRNGKLERTRNRTEACQTFAFFFKVTDRRKDAELWRRLRDEFGPCRDPKKTYPDIPKLGGFISGPMRLDLLSEAECGPQIFKDVLNPTVFEQLGPDGQQIGGDYSTWAGFTSVLVHVIHRDILGIRRVDTVRKQIEIRLQDISLESCEGVIPTPDGPITLRWTRHPDRLEYSLRHPDGYRVVIENRSNRTLVRAGANSHARCSRQGAVAIMARFRRFGECSRPEFEQNRPDVVNLLTTVDF